MALPILDGNQTSTTLATTVSGGAHYPNHIIASAVTIGSLPAISGTVTASVTNSVTIGSLPAISGTVTASNVLYKSGEWIKLQNAGSGSLSQSPQYLQRVGEQRWEGGSRGNDLLVITYNPNTSRWIIDGSVSTTLFSQGVAENMLPPVGNYVDENDNVRASLSYESPFPINGTVTVGNSVTIGSLPSISGTVTASVTNSVTVGSLPVQLSTTTIGGTSRLNVTLSSATTVGATAPSYGNLSGGSDGTNFRAILTDTSGRTVVTGSTSILGTSTVTFTAITGSTSIIGTPSVTFSAIAGTVTATVSSTTVTVSALPSGALTTRFGSVTTANTAQITTAVTNSSRKYLLAQNISAGTVTIGIGFSPTTTQGIQLTAGSGLTFDSFCPTGAVYWLSATTGATFTILEG